MEVGRRNRETLVVFDMGFFLFLWKNLFRDKSVYYIWSKVPFYERLKVYFNSFYVVKFLITRFGMMSGFEKYWYTPRKRSCRVLP